LSDLTQSGVKAVSSFIPKQPKKERNQITIKLDRDVLESLERYCRYLDSSRDYVINQCLVFIFRKDRHFAEWVETNGQVADGSTAKMATK
jgi:bacterioferritin (cytochrome b1)